MIVLYVLFVKWNTIIIKEVVVVAIVVALYLLIIQLLLVLTTTIFPCLRRWIRKWEWQADFRFRNLFLIRQLLLWLIQWMPVLYQLSITRLWTHCFTIFLYQQIPFIMSNHNNDTERGRIHALYRWESHIFFFHLLSIDHWLL